MNEVYIEHLIKRKKTAASIALKVLLITLTVITVLAMFIIPYAMIIVLIMAFADFYFLPMTDLEYEYTYIRGELDIDKIMGKQKRKNAKRCDLSTMEIFAPTNSHALDSYKNRNYKVRNFSTLNSDAKTYSLFLHTGSELEQIIFEPNEEMVEAIKLYAPSKSVMY